MQTSSQTLVSEIVVPVETKRGAFVNEMTNVGVSESVPPQPRRRILERRTARWARRLDR